MKINKDIKVPTLINIQSVSDDRGLLVPFTDDIDHDLFRRCYIVENYGKGVIRGLHYHKEEKKIFTIASGAAKFITFDLPFEMALRNDSSEITEYAVANPGAVSSFVISSRHHAVLYVPALYANGWTSLEDNTVLVSLGSLRFEDARHDDIRIDPMVVGEASWRVKGR